MLVVYGDRFTKINIILNINGIQNDILSGRGRNMKHSNEFSSNLTYLTLEYLKV